MKSLYRDWSPFVAFVLLGVCILLMFKRCDAPQPAIAVIPEMVKQGKVRTIIKWKTQVQTKEVIKWKVFKEQQLKDTTNPCGTEIRFVIQKADTVIRADSSLIASQRDLIKLDSAIIFKQGLMLKADSIHIVKLNRKVRRNRTIAKIAFITGLIGGGAAGVGLVR